MEKLGYVVGPLGLVVLIGALVVLLVPIAAFRTRRPMAKKVAIGAGIAFVFGLILTPSPKGAASVSAPAPSPTLAAPAKEDREAKTAVAQEAFVTMYRRVLEVAGPCDKAITSLGKTASAGDTYGTYRTARDGEKACRTASTEIDALEPPGNLTDEVRDDTQKALDMCRGAYASRQVALEKAKAIADGESRPSLMVDMEDHMKDGQTGVVMCVAQLISAGSKAGLAMDRLS